MKTIAEKSWGEGAVASRLAGERQHSQNEGKSHDVDENKGHENRMLESPTMLMKTKGFIFAIPRS
ncbi:MAG: hypothetical protein ACLQOO_12145 [Terriglobia bacterium]